MTEAEQIVRHLLEEQETTTIAKLMRQGNTPEMWVQDMFGFDDLDIPLTVREVDPASLLIHGTPLPKVVAAAKKSSTWKIVKAYMKDPGDPILISGKEVWDGHHRAMAAYLSKRTVRAVNVEELSVQESEEDLDDRDVGLPTPLEGFLQKRGFQIAVPPDLGFDKIFNRGSSRLRVGHMDRDEGVRKVEYYGGGTPLWTKYLTDEEILEMIDRNSRIGEAEEEDFGDEGAWKDVTPPVPASEIQRWCFTDFELKKPTMCNGTDEFLADGDADLAVVVLRNGTVTDRWEDGTTGVPPHCAQMADLDESPVNPEQRRQMFNEEDYYADNWRDVYVDKSGKFLGFVVRESEEDFEAEDEDLVRDMSANSLVDQVKREYFRAVFNENFPHGDSRELVKQCLIQLGVPWANASLIALEQGSSQAYVSRKYLADVGLQDAALRNAAIFIKFVYRLQNDESALEKYQWMLGESEEDFGDDEPVEVTPVIEPILMRSGFNRPSDYPDKWVRVEERPKPFQWVREIIWNDGQWNYQAQYRGPTGRWSTYTKEKFDTESDLLWMLKTYRRADVGSAYEQES